LHALVPRTVVYRLSTAEIVKLSYIGVSSDKNDNLSADLRVCPAMNLIDDRYI